MGLTLDVTSDYEIWDNTDPIVYVSSRRTSLGGNINWPVATALRQTMTLADSGNATAGVLLLADCKWFIPAKLLGRPAPVGIVPKAGDLIKLEITNEVRSWAVLSTTYEPFDQVYELACRDLSVSLDSPGATTIDVTTPLNRQDAALGRRPLMVPKYSGIACKIQEVSQATELSQGRRAAVKSYLIFTTTRLDVNEEDQIIDKTTGDIYDVIGYTNPDKLDEPQVIQASR